MLSDSKAREIAAQWYGYGGSPLHVLASTGAIVEGCDTEISGCITDIDNRPYETPEQDCKDISALSEYVEAAGVRGPVVTWGRMGWDL